MDAAPNDEGPVCTVPETAEQHGEHEVDVGADFAEAIASKRNIEIIAEPGAEADVPATPEILKAFGEIGLAEIHHEVKAKKLRAAAGDTAVAAEVSVNLPSESERAEEHGHGVGAAKTAGKDGIGNERAIVRDDHFAEETFQYEDESVEGFSAVPSAFLLDLGQKVRRALYRPGD